MNSKHTLFLLFAVFLSACSSQSKLTNVTNDSFSNLVNSIDSIFNDKDFESAFWGAEIKSLDNGKVWYERNAGKLFMPASNEKIVTTSVGLLTMGPKFQYSSNLGYRGEVRDSVLHGDLILYSNGDPTLYSRLCESSLVLFNKYASELSSLGIKKVTGNVYGDDTAFENEHIGYGWAYDGLSYWYSAPFGPLQINENYVDYKITPAKEAGGEVTVVPNIPTSYHKLENNLVTVDAVKHYPNMHRVLNSEVVKFNGEVKAGGRTFEWSPTVNDPTMFYLRVFREVLDSNGISVEGKSYSAYNVENFDDIKSGKVVISTYYSPEFAEIIKGLMKRSQNLYAETVARTISWYKQGKGVMRNSRALIYKKLAEFGLKEGSYLYRDGSGLSRYNYVSPKHLVKILEGMYSSEYKDLWLDIQPLAGVDGTLRRRMKGTAAEGNVRAKTGTIANVRGLSGYVTTADGENLVFSFLVNAHSVGSKDTERVTDSVLELIAAYNKDK